MATKYSSNSAWDAYKKNEQNKPKAFTYTAKKPTFSYDSKDINKYYDELLNRKDFTFDLNGNALYNQYKDMYQKQGQLAMMDTVGQASAMTGGYGNTYAVSAGQQAYQQSLDKLNDVVPEIYQLALEQYQLEGQNLLDKYGLAAGERDYAYGQHRDAIADYYTERDFAYGQHRDAVGDYQADRDYLYGVYADARDYEYREGRDKIADKQWQQEYDLQVKQFAEEVRQFEKQYQLSEKEFDEMVRQFALEHDLNVKQFNEDVRQYNTSLEYTKYQDSVQNSQWAQEFAEEQRQYDESMALSQKELDEAIRHNLANEGKNDVNDTSMEEKELAEKQRQYELDLLTDLGILNEDTIKNYASMFGDTLQSIFGGGKSSGNVDVDYENLPASDQSLIRFVADRCENFGISNNPEAIKNMLDEMYHTNTIDKRQRELCDRYFLQIK